jgi:ribonuclease D
MKKLIYNKFDKPTIATLRRVVYHGKIVVINTPDEAEAAVDHLLSQPVLGLDTETRPSFTKGRHFKCSLLQVAGKSICFLFRLNHIGMCPAVMRLLGDKTVTKVGLAWRNDLLALKEVGEFEPGTFVDLQDMVREIGIEDQSLVKIYANLFGERISKADRLSNWERDNLKDTQMIYAAIDAWACVQIYEEVLRLKATGDYELVVRQEEIKQEHDEANISETR